MKRQITGCFFITIIFYYGLKLIYTNSYIHIHMQTYKYIYTHQASLKNCRKCIKIRENM